MRPTGDGALLAALAAALALLLALLAAGLATGAVEDAELPWAGGPWAELQPMEMRD